MLIQLSMIQYVSFLQTMMFFYGGGVLTEIKVSLWIVFKDIAAVQLILAASVLS